MEVPSKMLCRSIILSALLIVVAESIEYYDKKYDNIDTAEILRDPEQYQKFTGCLLNKLPCDAFLEGFKKIVPETIEQACAKCSPQLKCEAKIYFNGVEKDHPDDYEQFKKLYDPKGIYFDAFRAAVDKATCTLNDDGEYGSQFDDLNIKEILDDPEKYQQYINCYLDKGPCTKMEAELKELLPEIVRTACTKCSSALKCSAKLFYNAIEVEHPKDYEALRKKYDPEGKYFKTFIAVINLEDCPDDEDEDFDYYIKEFEEYDLKEALDDPIKYEKLVGCLLDRNPCDKVPGDFKDFFPEFLETACVECPQPLRCKIKYFINTLRAEHPKDYEELKEKYDPDEKYFDIFLAVIEATKCPEDEKNKGCLYKKYENLDVEEVLCDDDTYKRYIGCLLDRRDCNKNLEGLKELLPKVIEESCEKCTSKLKCVFAKLFEGLKREHHEDYKEFKEKYDPKGKYFESFEDAIDESGCSSKSITCVVTKYDNIDIYEILDSNCKYEKLFGCLLHRFPCTEYLLELRGYLHEQVRQGCARCSPRFKCINKIFVKKNKVLHPDDYREFQRLYDPNGLYFDKYLSTIEASDCSEYSETYNNRSFYYDQKYDNLNAILLLSPGTYENYIGCLLGNLPCNEYYAEFISILPQLIKEKCARCNAELKCNVKEFFKRVKIEHPKDYESIIKKYDPSTIYIKGLEEALEPVKCPPISDIIRKFDNIDINEIFDNPSSYEKLFGCFLDRSSCTKFNSELKEYIEDVIPDLCCHCSPVYKCHGQIFHRRLKEEHPVDYKEYIFKRDPTGEYIESYKKVIYETECPDNDYSKQIENSDCDDPSQYYDEKYDTNVDEIFNNPDKYEKFVGCLLDRSPCTKFLTELKGVIVEVFENSCCRCSPAIKCHIRLFYQRLQAEHPKDFKEYLLKYDPKGNFNSVKAVLEAAHCPKACNSHGQYYDSKFNIDPYEVLYNPVEYKLFIECVLDKSPCAKKIWSELKEVISEAVVDGCCKCSPVFSCYFKTFLDGIKKYHPKDYKQYRLRYDPERKYFDELEAIFDEGYCPENCGDPSQFYDSKFERLNIDDVFDDADKYEKFMGCILDRTPCNKISQDFKDIIPESIEEICCRCSPKLKCNARTLLRRLKIEHPKDYNDFKQTYDPEGLYFDTFERNVNKEICPLKCDNQTLHYDIKYDTVNPDELLDNPTKYRKFINCILDKSTCGPFLQGYKEIIPELIEQSCCKCTPVLKCNMKTFLKRFKAEHPKDYQEYRLKYDPESKYFDALEAALDMIGCPEYCGDPSQYYDIRIDADKLLDDVIEYENFKTCLLDGKSCNKELATLKDILPEAVEETCCKCSLQFKCSLKTLLSRIIVEHPEDYKEYTKTFDPTGKYADSFAIVINNAVCPIECKNHTLHYDFKYDSVDMNEIFDYPARYEKFVGCLLDRAPCDQFLQGLKEIIPDSIEKACCKCTPVFKCNSKIFIRRLKEEHPKDYLLYRLKYDPEGKYFDLLEATLEASVCPDNCGDPSQYYDRKFDGIDIDEIFDDLTTYEKFIGCILDRSACDKLTLDLKGVLYSAIEERCCKCSPKFKCIAKTYILRSKVEHPDDFEEVRKKYDPTGEYYETYERVVEAQVCPQECKNQTLHYDSKYDSINPDEILNNPGIYEKVIGCLLDRSPCDPLFQGLKEIIPESIRQACCKCTPVYRCNSKRFLSRLRVEHPKDYNDYKLKYDPEGIYFQNLEAYLDTDDCPKYCNDPLLYYDSKYERMAIDQWMDDPNSYHKFIGCLLDTSYCDIEIASLKDILPQAINEGCCKCSPKFKCVSKTFITRLKIEHPEHYKAYRVKYDPEGKYFDTYESILQTTDCFENCNNPSQYYETKKYELIEVDEIFTNTDRYQNFIGCFLNKYPCDTFLVRYKEVVIQSIKQACCRCSPRYKCFYRSFLKRLKEKYPNDHDEYWRIYDPERKYYTNLAAVLKDEYCSENCNNPANYYDTKYDGIEIDELFEDHSKYEVFVGCLLDRYPCNKFLIGYKETVYASFEESCCRCSQRYKCNHKKLFKRLKAEYPKDYWDLRRKHDPEGRYYEKLEAVLNDEYCIETRVCNDPSKYYVLKYNVDLDEIINNKVKHEKFIKCLLGKSSCDVTWTELIEILPMSMKDGCCRCSPIIKCHSKKIFTLLKSQYSSYYWEYRSKYDPEGIYFERYEAVLEETYCSGYPNEIEDKNKYEYYNNKYHHRHHHHRHRHDHDRHRHDHDRHRYDHDRHRYDHDHHDRHRHHKHHEHREHHRHHDD